MGYNTVAVIYNDLIGYPYRSLERMDQVIKNYYSPTFNDDRDDYFGFGSVISQAHADIDQIVVVSANFGYNINDPKYKPSSWVCTKMSEFLEKNGYEVRKKMNEESQSG